MKELFWGCVAFTFIMSLISGCVEPTNSNGLTQSEQEYWDSRSTEEKVQILSDYYEDTNPHWNSNP